MYIKRYSVAAFILIALVYWYVFAFVTHESMSINVFGVVFPPLHIATLIAIPLVVLAVASAAHMLFYSIVGSFKLRRYEKDYDKIIDSIVESYLHKKEKNYSYKTDRYQLLGSLVDKTMLMPKNDLTPSTNNDKINNVIKIIEDIKNGEVVDLKKYQLLADNPIVIQNERNRYKKGDITAEAILGNTKNKYADSLKKEVYVDCVKKATLSNIEKYKSFMSKEALVEILARVNAEKDALSLSNEVIISFFKELELTTKEYIEISSQIATFMIPEQRMKLFESLSEKDERVVEAYLFTLFDLELLAPADEILENSQDDEYVNFKAYRALKACNKNFNINLFV